MGGTDDPLNLTPPISIPLHAEFHRDLYETLGHQEDYVAWKNLLGLDPTGVYKHSKEIKKSLSETSKSLWKNSAYRKKSTEAMSISSIGNQNSKGNIPWNKDKIGIYSKESLEKMRICKLGNQFAKK